MPNPCHKIPDINCDYYLGRLREAIAAAAKQAGLLLEQAQFRVAEPVGDDGVLATVYIATRPPNDDSDRRVTVVQLATLGGLHWTYCRVQGVHDSPWAAHYGVDGRGLEAVAAAATRPGRVPRPR